MAKITNIDTTKCRDIIFSCSLQTEIKLGGLALLMTDPPHGKSSFLPNIILHCHHFEPFMQFENLFELERQKKSNSIE